jgi:hypothetical protein
VGARPYLLEGGSRALFNETEHPRLRDRHPLRRRPLVERAAPTPFLMRRGPPAPGIGIPRAAVPLMSGGSHAPRIGIPCAASIPDTWLVNQETELFYYRQI